MPFDALPRELRSLLDQISRLAGTLGLSVYLVGGAVRDLLLERPIRDLDLAVEGDATALGRALAEALPARLGQHAAFGTAVLETNDAQRIDLATLRRESYAADAALPDVSPGTLREDLLRRDFTVNSMALALEDGGYPELVDPSGGRADLAARLLRVHHERSFLDDPTRILRGVRLAARLGFAFEARTESWARQAVESGVFERLSSDRLVAELELLFAEEADLALLWSRLEELGVLGAIGLAPSAATPERLTAVRRQIGEWRRRYDRDYPISESRTLLGAVLLGQPAERRARLGERLRLSPVAVAELDRLDEAAALLERPELVPSRLNAALETLSAEALLLLQVPLAAGGSAADRIHHHLSAQRPLRLRVNGKTLRGRGFPPGPEIGRALRATRDARLDGRIGPEDELAFAVERLRAEKAPVGEGA